MLPRVPNPVWRNLSYGSKKKLIGWSGSLGLLSTAGIIYEFHVPPELYHLVAVTVGIPMTVITWLEIKHCLPESNVKVLCDRYQLLMENPNIKTQAEINKILLEYEDLKSHIPNTYRVNFPSYEGRIQDP